MPLHLDARGNSGGGEYSRRVRGLGFVDFTIPVKISPIKSVPPGSCIERFYEPHGSPEETPKVEGHSIYGQPFLGGLLSILWKGSYNLRSKAVSGAGLQPFYKHSTLEKNTKERTKETQALSSSSCWRSWALAWARPAHKK